MNTHASTEHRYNALFGTRVRFFVLILILLCLSSIWSNILAINFVMICMDPIVNGTEAENYDKHHITPTEYQWYLSIVAIAALSSNFFAVYLSDRIGVRTVFTTLGLLSAVSTALMPMAIRNGFWAIMVVRFFQGVSFSVNYAVIGAFCAKWAYFKQVGLLVSVLVAYVQLSPVITMSISGPICTSSLGWPAVFYFHSVATFFLFVFYGFFYRNSPQKHPFVGTIEKSKIAVGKVVVNKAERAQPPYLDIIRTPAVWAVWGGAVANFGAVNLMLSFSPIYLSRVLGFTINKTGFSAALPPLLQFIAKVIVGIVSDRMTCLSETNKLRFFNSVAMYCCGGCFCLLGFLGTEHPTINMLVLGAAAGFLGMDTGGFFKAGPIISRQYSHIVTGVFSIVLTGMMLIVPMAVNAILDDHMTIDRWQRVFTGCAACMIIISTVFCIFIRGEPAWWTKEEPKKTENVNMKEDAKVENGIQGRF